MRNFYIQSLNIMIAEIVSIANAFWKNLTKYILSFLHFFLVVFPLAGMQIIHLLPQTSGIFHYPFLFSIVMSMLQGVCVVFFTASLEIDALTHLSALFLRGGGTIALFTPSNKSRSAPNPSLPWPSPNQPSGTSLAKNSYLIWR